MVARILVTDETKVQFLHSPISDFCGTEIDKKCRTTELSCTRYADFVCMTKRYAQKLKKNRHDMLIDDLSKLPDGFKQGYRGIMLLHRNKDGCTGNAQRKSTKKISSNMQEWNEIVQEFAYLQQHTHQGYRIYSSVNQRNMEKAVREFKRRQLDMDYGSTIVKHNWYASIKEQFFSCVMNPTCREQSYFLIDCDTELEYQQAIEKIPNYMIALDYETKNGRHLVTEPFNPNEIQIEVHKDDLLYIG